MANGNIDQRVQRLEEALRNLGDFFQGSLDKPYIPEQRRVPIHPEVRRIVDEALQD